MIIGLIHQGSGLGNQLFRYTMTRIIAEEKGFEWGMATPENFKASWLKLDFGKKIPFETNIEFPSGKTIVKCNWSLFEEDTSDYDWSIKGIKDNTIIDGEFQGEEYFEHRLDDMRKWFEVEPIKIANNVCVINFRGGEYQYYPELFLTKDYWDTAIGMMKENGVKYFIVTTDDIPLAKKFFPEYECLHNMEEDWKCIRFAKNLILSNSSFAILPALLNENTEMVIAPRGWARRNVGGQMLKYNKYKKFQHI